MIVGQQKCALLGVREHLSVRDRSKAASHIVHAALGGCESVGVGLQLGMDLGHESA